MSSMSWAYASTGVWIGDAGRFESTSAVDRPARQTRAIRRCRMTSLLPCTDDDDEWLALSSRYQLHVNIAVARTIHFDKEDGLPGPQRQATS